jgi:Protein of unknown function (DUF3187)
MTKKSVIFLTVIVCGRGALGAAEPSRSETRVVAPLPWRECTPTARMFLQLPFETPTAIGKGEVEGEINLLYANSNLIGSARSVAIDVDMESAELQALFRYGFASGFEAQLALPLIVNYGGFLDGPIEWTERFFGARSMPHRRDHPRNRSVFRMVSDGAGIEKPGAGAGLGDLWTGFKVSVTDQTGIVPMVAFRAAIKVPTGRLPYGSGTVDLGGSLLLGWSWRLVSLWIELDVAYPTADLKAAHFFTQAYGAAQLGLAISLARSLALNLQWSSHLSPFEHTGVPQLDAPVHYLLLGFSIELSRRFLLEAGAVENIFSPASGVDFAMFLGLRIRPEKSYYRGHD